MKLRTLFFATLLTLGALSCNCGQDMTEKKVEEVLSQMTLDEKIAIIHAQSKFSSPGVGRLGIPELWMDDGPNGVRPDTFWDAWADAGNTNDSCTAYPGLTSLAATWDRQMAAKYGRSVGEEARYRRKNVLLGPGINIYRTPLCGRNFEYMGEDPFLAGEMSAEYIRGLQSNGVGASVKHFALNNNEFERHNTNVIVDDRTLYEIYLPAFRAAVQKGGAWTVMAAYNLYENEHLCHSNRLLNTILKEEWGFDGTVVSDWGGVHDTYGAVKGGMDLEFGSWTNGVDLNVANAYDKYYMAEPYKRMILSGEFGTEELDDKCRRVLRLMMRTSYGPENGYGRFTCPDHYALARKVGADGIVLLKNENNLLPLPEDVKKIVVLGENAIKPMAVGGSSSSLKVQHEITPLQGIKNRYPEAEIVYERAYLGTTNQGPYRYSRYDISDPRSPEDMLSDALEAVKDADYVIFVGGQNKIRGGDCEGADRAGYHLLYGQDEVISAIAEARPDLVYVSVAGSSYAMPWLDKVGAVVQAWYMGSEAGNSLADVLSGDVNPSGKLPFSWGAELEDYPIRTEAQYPGIKRADENIWDMTYSEGIYVGYRWFDKGEGRLLFPFGYGLSYTSFEYSKPRASAKCTSTGVLTFKIDVTNTGSRAGAEVVQLYIHDNSASVDRPEKELKGFEKVFLAPGETKTVSIDIDPTSLAFFDVSQHKWKAEKGEFTALFASSAASIRAEIPFSLKKDIVFD